MDKNNGLDYSKVTEEEIEKAEVAEKDNHYTVLDMLKEIVGEDEEVGENDVKS